MRWPWQKRKRKPLADLMGGLATTGMHSNHLHVGGSYHYGTPAADIAKAPGWDKVDWGKLAEAFSGAITSAYRTAGQQMAKLAMVLRQLRVFPEFAALDDIRWKWPSHRVRNRPFDYEYDFEPRGPDDLKLGEVRWFS
jgi:hypothetical protein